MEVLVELASGLVARPAARKVPIILLRLQRIQILHVAAADRTGPIALHHHPTVSLLLLPFPLPPLPPFHLLLVLAAVQRHHLQARQVPLHEFLQPWQQFRPRPIGAAVVVDDELVAAGFARGTRVGRAVGDVGDGPGRVCGPVGGGVGVGALVAVRSAADEELAGKGNVDVDVAVHGVLGEQVDAEFGAGLGEAPLGVEGEHVGEDAAALVEVHELEELQRHVAAGGREGAEDGAAVVVVDACELVVEGAVEDPATQAVRGEHAGHEGLEFDVAVVELGWDGPAELELVGLEARWVGVRIACSRGAGGRGAKRLTYLYCSVSFPSFPFVFVGSFVPANLPINGDRCRVH